MKIRDFGRAIGRTIGRGYVATVGGANGYGGGGFRSRYGQAGVDIAAEAGALIDSSVVFPVLTFIDKEIRKMPMYVARPDSQGKLVKAPNHPLQALLERPNPNYDGADLVSGLVMAAILGGNGHALKHRSGARRLVALEYLPLHACWAESLPGSGMFVDRYRVNLPSGSFAAAPENILHLRWHVRDPYRFALGLSPLMPVYPEIAADRRASRYEAAIQRRQGRGYILAPEGKTEDGEALTFGRDQREQFEAVLEENLSGDNAGGMTVMPYPMRAVQIGFSPADMQQEKTHDLSEERVAAQFNIPPVVIGFGSGMDSQTNRASYDAALLQAIIAGVGPIAAHIAKGLTEDLVPELGEPGDVVVIDWERHPVVLKATAEAMNQATGGAHLTVNERRAAEGLTSVPGGDVVRGLPTSTASGGDPAEEPDK